MTVSASIPETQETVLIPARYIRNMETFRLTFPGIGRDFKQQTVAPYKRSNDTLESFVIHMFQKGVTMSEISHLIERMYGHHYTPQTISNMTQAVTEEGAAFRQRSLSER